MKDAFSSLVLCPVCGSILDKGENGTWHCYGSRLPEGLIDCYPPPGLRNVNALPRALPVKKRGSKRFVDNVYTINGDLYGMLHVNDQKTHMPGEVVALVEAGGKWMVARFEPLPRGTGGDNEEEVWT